jgi:hypothetical protein
MLPRRGSRRSVSGVSLNTTIDVRVPPGVPASD